MRAFLLIVLAAARLTASEDPRELVRRSIRLSDQDLAAARNYTFLERDETRELDGNGQVQTHNIKLFDVTLLEGSPYRRLVGRDDHPLPPDEQTAEEQKLRASIEDRRKET